VTGLYRKPAGRIALGLAAAGTLLIAVSSCAAPAYNYASDSADGAYFKVPSSWQEISANSVAEAQTELSQSAAGAKGGVFTWSRAYSPAVVRSPGELFAGSDQPIVYASVQTINASLQSQLSFDDMRDLLFPVTSQARSEAKSEGSTLTGFQSIGSSTITDSNGIRGINELYEYTINGQPDAFDQTVLTNSSTTKLYLLLVQCYQACFVAHEAQIKMVVDSFTVRGS
jgi:hypothetical protein